MSALAWVIGILIAIILFGVVLMGILCIVEWIVEIKLKARVDVKDGR